MNISHNSEKEHDLSEHITCNKSSASFTSETERSNSFKNQSPIMKKFLASLSNDDHNCVLGYN